MAVTVCTSHWRWDSTATHWFLYVFNWIDKECFKDGHQWWVIQQVHVRPTTHIVMFLGRSMGVLSPHLYSVTKVLVNEATMLMYQAGDGIVVFCIGRYKSHKKIFKMWQLLGASSFHPCRALGEHQDLGVISLVCVTGVTPHCNATPTTDKLSRCTQILTVSSTIPLLPTCGVGGQGWWDEWITNCWTGFANCCVVVSALAFILNQTQSCAILS